MKSKKLEVIITRIKTLNREELKQLSNEVEAEIQFRDKDFGKKPFISPDYELFEKHNHNTDDHMEEIVEMMTPDKNV